MLDCDIDPPAADIGDVDLVCSHCDEHFAGEVWDYEVKAGKAYARCPVCNTAAAHEIFFDNSKDE